MPINQTFFPWGYICKCMGTREARIHVRTHARTHAHFKYHYQQDFKTFVSRKLHQESETNNIKNLLTSHLTFNSNFPAKYVIVSIYIHTQDTIQEGQE